MNSGFCILGFLESLMYLPDLLYKHNLSTLFNDNDNNDIYAQRPIMAYVHVRLHTCIVLKWEASASSL